MGVTVIEKTGRLRTYAKSIGCNELRARAEAGVSGLVDEGVVSDEFVGDDLDANEFGNFEQLVARNTQKESDRVHDVAQKQLQGQIWSAVLSNVEVPTPPAEKTVDQADESDNAEQSGHDHASDLDTEPSTVGESVQGVGRAVLIIIWHNNATGGDGFLGLRIAHLGYGQRGGDRHDAGGDEGLRV